MCRLLSSSGVERECNARSQIVIEAAAAVRLGSTWLQLWLYHAFMFMIESNTQQRVLVEIYSRTRTKFSIRIDLGNWIMFFFYYKCSLHVKSSQISMCASGFIQLCTQMYGLFDLLTAVFDRSY